VDCDSGICLGNSHKPADVAVHATGCIVRNNMLTRVPENGILADYTRDCRILHNTVHDPASRLRRLIRVVHDNQGLVIANNLLSGPPPSMEWGGQVLMAGNTIDDVTRYFEDVAEGNLRLGLAAGTAVRPVLRIPHVPEDIDTRPRGARTYPGAGGGQPPPVRS
jgi:hypothetical protein